MTTLQGLQVSGFAALRVAVAPRPVSPGRGVRRDAAALRGHARVLRAQADAVRGASMQHLRRAAEIRAMAAELSRNLAETASGRGRGV